MKQLLIRALLAVAALAVPVAQAQDYPSRPIRWIVPYLAGTGPDITVRAVAEAMAGVLRQPIVVDNKPGAAGNLGAQQAARAAPDGYTWVYSASTMSSNMRMYRKPGYDVMTDFTHVGRISMSDVLLVVNADAGITTARELIELGRRNPGKLSFASGGVGTPAHMGMEMILHATGVKALHVPYKGASESVNAVMGKQVDFALTISSVSMPYVQAGKMRALAVSGPRRNPRMPTVPTLAEAGIPGVTLVSVGGLSVPAGTPAPIVRRIAEALNKVLAMPELRAKLEAHSGIVSPSSPEAYAEDLKAEIAQAEQMMRTAHIEPQ